MKSMQMKILASLLLVLLAVFSVFVMGKKYSDPEAYRKVIDSIEVKTQDALKLTGTATVASAGISLLPDDVATPVAEKLADCTQYFLIALCVLYAEKYLLPIIGLAVFRILIPAFALLVIFCIFTNKGGIAGNLAIRILTFAIVIYAAIPVSVYVSDKIYETYRTSIESTIRETESLTQDVSIFSSSNGTTFIERATNLLSSLFETLAVTIATSCLIPILVVLFFVWLAKMLIGVAIPSPLVPIGRPPLPDKKAEAEEPGA